MPRGGEEWLRLRRARAVSSDDGIAGVFNKTFIGVLPGVTALAGMVPLRVWDSVVNEIQRALIWTGLLGLERQVTRYYVWGERGPRRSMLQLPLSEA